MRRATTRLALEALEDRTVPATLPANFSEAAVATGLSAPTAMELSPQGKLFIAEQAGTMEVWQGGTRLQSNFFADALLTAYNPATDSGRIDRRGERGLLGVTFAPDFATTRHVFVYYTYAVNADGNAATPTAFRNRVSRFTADAAGERALAGSERVILELDDLSGATNHNGGALHFGPDGKLYVAVGDNADSANARVLTTRHGKMLRVNADGTVPADNPFVNVASGANRAIWALGLRNPFTFTFQPGTGRMHINDVGQGSFEEINVGASGANYGWPATEGDFNQASFPNFTRPLYAYAHGGGTFEGFAITGGAFYDPAAPAAARFPAGYQGDYFFADFGNGWINSIDLATRGVARFASNVASPVDLDVAPDGALLYLERDAGRVMRVAYTANQAPQITAPPADQAAPRGAAVTFSASASGSSPLAYRWQRAEAGTSDWADVGGATASSFTLASTQAADDGDRFRVVVTNPFGSATSDPATLTVTANEPPAPALTIDAGLTGGKFVAGQPVTFSGSATDAEDGAVPAARLTWRVDYITSIAGGSPVVRPFVPEFSGAGGTFTPATVGPYTLTDVAYRVVLTATDGDGARTTVTRDLAPNTARVTIDTVPAGLEVTVDGQPHPAPYAFDSVVGFRRAVEAGVSQLAGGATYEFGSWSDGGAARHTVVTPAADATLTAAYAATDGFRVRINFGAATSAGFAGYLDDAGSAFGARGFGFSYGWDRANAVIAFNRNRPESPDERYDTFHRPSAGAVWELAVPDGTYTVRVVSGDPHPLAQAGALYRTNVEGARAVNGVPLGNLRWADGTVTVAVTDGRLTLTTGAGARLNKINFVEVRQVPPAELDGLVAVDAGAYHGNVGSGYHAWRPTAAGMRAGPNLGAVADAGAAAARLDYRINFARAGTYYVWIRGSAATAADDTVHVGVDGVLATRVTGFGPAAGWRNRRPNGAVARIVVASAGVHTVNLWMAEDGLTVGRLLLTADAGYVPPAGV
ncbi:MAG: PQQ-dependent sugar dehydrogenase [Gemmataceae bacterium]